MQKNTAKKQFPGSQPGIADNIAGFAQRIAHPKWLDRALGRDTDKHEDPPRETSGYGSARHRGTSNHKVPFVEELPPEKEVPKSLDFEILGKGGLLQIFTRNTTYSFRMLNQRDAVLSTDRENRPEGLVQLRGCSYGCAGSISPDRIFCGGNLEFSCNATRQVHITSEIHAMKYQPEAEVQAA